MTKYRVTWLFNDGKNLQKTYEADLIAPTQNGGVAFIIKNNVQTINLSPTGQQEESLGEMIANVVGFNIIEKV
jgi:hypothetical protein